MVSLCNVYITYKEVIVKVYATFIFPADLNEHFGQLITQYTFFKGSGSIYSVPDFILGHLFDSFLLLLLKFQHKFRFPFPFCCMECTEMELLLYSQVPAIQ